MPWAEPLDADALADALTALPDWSGDAAGIVRSVSLPTFPAAIAVVDQVAVAAEELNHHPDIDIRWRELTFALTTHAADDSVTRRDIEMAHRIDAIVSASHPH
jgi:4a-hydroxytetrahydrobiopterin dehydratase